MDGVDAVFDEFDPDLVVHFAAESHVDRSIRGPREFIRTNIEGTFNLLEACRKRWSRDDNRLFQHVSTDEVYGSLGETGLFEETTSYDPSSPYSASKAASDHIVRAYHRTYGLPIKITNCSNNYGPMQFPEKLMPLMILNAVERKPLPIYGAGLNVRDWLYVEDHCDAIWTVIEKGRVGRTYNIGGNNEMQNIDVIDTLCQIVAEETGSRHRRPPWRSSSSSPTDPGTTCAMRSMRRGYARSAVGSPRKPSTPAFARRCKWYLSNEDWVQGVRSGEYRKWIDLNYGDRTG